ncbi:hypothetical protein SAMN04488546_1572 [Geodermatophilus poikilotrophus]|uniref:Uncharacterized protein n=1 Tax=Geodermatophilus poikilotrophus TaxID=1333667 RepID=A0A1I0CGA9_9ACTN|nr:hypothetical protein SAMN04488546_1572 [Geodermatophilus poikilotrophus]
MDGPDAAAGKSRPEFRTRVSGTQDVAVLAGRGLPDPSHQLQPLVEPHPSQT